MVVLLYVWKVSFWYYIINTSKKCAAFVVVFFFFQAEDGIRDLVRSRGLGDVYKRQALTHGGTAAVKFSGLRSVLEAMVLSPFFGFAIGLVLMVILSWVFFRVPRALALRLFSRMQLVSASFMAFSHGANDAQKAMGIITLALVSAGVLPTAEVPTWVIGSCALAMGLGTAVGGWRIVRTLGMRIVKLEPVHGFAAETGAAIVLLATAHIGLPVSTTHTITSTVMGVGAVKRLSAVRWGVTRRILSAWLFTLPGAALLSTICYLFLSKLQ